jgi:hypothetical protein
MLEPVKPVSAYLIASGHFVSGVLALVLSEVLKILIVVRRRFRDLARWMRKLNRNARAQEGRRLS